MRETGLTVLFVLNLLFSAYLWKSTYSWDTGPIPAELCIDLRARCRTGSNIPKYVISCLDDLEARCPSAEAP